MADSTTIAPNTVVSGRISGDGELSVRGHVDGDIELSDQLTIADEGRVDGNVSAREIVVEGTIQGTITAEQRVVLTASARAVADIEAPQVQMDDGAQLRGELTIGGGSTTSATASTASPRRSRTESTTSSRPATTRRETSTATATGAATRRESATATTTTVVEETDDDEDADAGESQQPTISEEKVEQYRQDFTVKELRQQLRDRDLQVSGTKDELIERLLHHDLTAAN